MSALSIWNMVLAVVAGYLIGSFPTGVLLARVLKTEDPRQAGSGHTGGSNMWRLAGPVPGVVTGLVDLAKGALVVWILLQIVPNGWMVPLAGTAAVAGHCWPIFADFRGGMGIATAAGLALWFFPLLIPIFALLYLLLNRFLRHQARSVMLISATIPLVLVALGEPAAQLALGIGISFVLIIRFAGDFHRVYE
ncbi:MAG: glycerol-3-phosphate acyltransferase [Caldilineae bacterium]|nr:MAG: glycerol-3-phosphate acyltransferase [Caldilineae bacterium]